MEENADCFGGLSLLADYAAKIFLGHPQLENQASLALGPPHVYCVGVIHQLLGH
jgi:hypothetical protein